MTKIEDCRKYYACIGLHSHGEKVTINAGRKPFVFDIGKHARSLSKNNAWMTQESEFYLESDLQGSSVSSTAGLFASSGGSSSQAPQWERERERSINVNPLARIVENINKPGSDKDEDLIAYCREVLRGKQFQGIYISLSFSDSSAFFLSFSFSLSLSLFFRSCFLFPARASPPHHNHNNKSIFTILGLQTDPDTVEVEEMFAIIKNVSNYIDDRIAWTDIPEEDRSQMTLQDHSTLSAVLQLLRDPGHHTMQPPITNIISYYEGQGTLSDRKSVV